VPDAEEGNLSAPSSPYSATVAGIRNLTMPPVPNFDIPPSPPGSPPQPSTKKFANFLELKKKGVHFNAKLDSSSAIRNPAVLPKLLEFAGIDHYDQYALALPEELSIPTSYPPWAYGEELNKNQQKLLKRREADKSKSVRERIDFVSSVAGSSSNTGSKRQEVRSGSPKHKRRRSRSR
jgi:HCNGP-like protein